MFVISSLFLLRLTASVDRCPEGVHLRRSSPQTIITAVRTQVMQIWLVKGRSYSHTVAYNFWTLKHSTVQCLNVRKSYLLHLSYVESQGIHVRLSDVDTANFKSDCADISRKYLNNITYAHSGSSMTRQ